jgi:hypothetical protein
MNLIRPQWPHTIQDIIGALDGIWGIVGAISVDGNLLRLERSLKEPLTYSLTFYKGENESEVVNCKTYNSDEKMVAVNEFAKQLGFTVS